MPLNKVKPNSNMYSFVDATWNVIKGKCPHDCSYCYMKRFPQKPLRLDEKEFKTDLGKGNFIFVGSSCDMWAEDISDSWIEQILKHCNKFPANKYLFQSKNPKNFEEFIEEIPKDSILATTIETNRQNKITGGEGIVSRAMSLAQAGYSGFKTVITIEPIMDFDLNEFIALISMAHPQWVNIGADSQGHKLPEPSKEKVEQLIEELKENNITIKKKSNLARIK